MTTKKIPTILRRSWHRKTDRWQATDLDGKVHSFHHRPWFSVRWCEWMLNLKDGFYQRGPDRVSPVHARTTLRRIIDRPAKGKGKRP